jgi:CRISPR-associated protein Csx10
VETLPYIPGSALRGAVAQEWLKKKGASSASSPEFCSVFTGSGVRWGNLYPINTDYRDRDSYPIPLSAQTCKWNSGFLTDDDVNEAGDGIWDILLWQAARIAGKPAPDEVKECPICGAPLDDAEGFYRYGKFGLARVKAKARLLARTALMEKTETAKAGMLFTLEAIEELQEFAGFIEVPDNAPGINYLEQLLQSAQTYRIGSARTRGLGAIKIADNPKPVNNYLNLDPLNDRLSTFQQKAIQCGLDKERFWFSLTLYSDAIVTDIYGRFRSLIDEGTLKLEERFWGSSPEFPSSLRHEISFAITCTVSGWNMAPGWRLPKYDVVAIGKGSVFLFSVDVNDQDSIKPCLQKLEAYGIGERRQEGFGQVIVSSPFHANPEGGAP